MEQKKLGRPLKSGEKRVLINVRLPVSLAEWLRTHKNYSAVVESMIREKLGEK